MTPVVHARRETCFAQAGFVDTPGQQRQFLGHCQHHGEGVLRHSDIHPPAKRMDLYATRCTGLEVDIARVGPEVMDDFQIWRLGQFRFSNSQAFADDSVRVVQRCQ